MSIIEFIILAIALSFEAMIVMYSCVSNTSIPLSKGLAESFIIAMLNALLLLFGLWVGNILRFTPQSLGDSTTRDLLTDTDNMVCLALMIFVALRMVFRLGKKNYQIQPYDISRYSITLLLGVAVGINSLIIGLALGFRIDASDNFLRAFFPMVVVNMFMTYFGIMLGRQHKELRRRRYAYIAALLILAFALKGALWS